MNSAATQPNLLELAKQGNAQAIATLMNRQLQIQGISAKAALKDDCIQITVESAQIPNKQAIAAFIRKGLTSLNPKSIKRVKIHGKRINTESPAWSVEFEIGTDGNQTNTLEKTEEKTDSALSEPKTTENSKEKPRSKSFVLESTGNKKLDFILVTTVIALGSAILIALGWGNSQVTAPSSFNAESAPSTTTVDLDSVAAGSTIVKGTKNFIFVVGLATDTPVITILLPRTAWNNLDEKSQENVNAYAKSLIPIVRANPTAYVDIPSTAPIYKDFVRKAESLCTDCWQIEVGQPTESGSLTRDEAVARGRY